MNRCVFPLSPRYARNSVVWVAERGSFEHLNYIRDGKLKMWDGEGFIWWEVTVELADSREAMFRNGD